MTTTPGATTTISSYLIVWEYANKTVLEKKFDIYNEEKKHLRFDLLFKSYANKRAFKKSINVTSEGKVVSLNGIESILKIEDSSLRTVFVLNKVKKTRLKTSAEIALED